VAKIKELKKCATELNDVLEFSKEEQIDLSLEEKELVEEIIDVSKLLEEGDVLSDKTMDTLKEIGGKLPDEEFEENDGVEEKEDGKTSCGSSSSTREEKEEDNDDPNELPKDVSAELLRTTVKELNKVLGTKLRAVGVKKDVVLTSIHETIKQPSNKKKLGKVSKEVKEFLKTFTIMSSDTKVEKPVEKKEDKKPVKAKTTDKKVEKKEKTKTTTKVEKKKKEKAEKKGIKRGAKKERNEYIKNLIKEGKYTPAEIQEMTLEKFPDNTPGAVKTPIVDCKNPKYNPFKDVGLGYINKKGHLTFKKD